MQLLQAQLNARGEGNIPIRLVLPQSTVVQQNTAQQSTQLAELLKTAVTQQGTVVQPAPQQIVIDPNVIRNQIIQ